MIGELISAGINLWAGNKQAKANKAAQELDYQRQKEFAQSGIQWKAEDAKKAGIHPVYALGGSTASFSPLGVGDTGTQHLAAAGQDLGRAIDSTRTASSRASAYDKTVQDLSLTRMGLENELLASQIAKVRGQIGPPMAGSNYLIPGQTASGLPPGHEIIDPQYTAHSRIAGDAWEHNPGWTNAQTMEDRYGESSDWIYGPAVIAADYYHNFKKKTAPMKMARKFYDKYNPGNTKGWTR